MTTKSSVRLCYQMNGGYCKNKVSASNNYVCAAGHRGNKNTGGVAINRPFPKTLYEVSKYDQHELVCDPSIDRDTVQALFHTGDKEVRRELAKNPSIDRDTAIQLAKLRQAPIGYLKNMSIDDLSESENVALVNEYPQEFGAAFIERLLSLNEKPEKTKVLLFYSYDAYKKAGGTRADYYREQILEKYQDEEELKIFLS